MRIFPALALSVCLCASVYAEESKTKGKSAPTTGKSETPPPTSPPMQSVEIGKLPAGCDRLELFILAGQSNMKGRGVMPDVPKRDPRIVMMHMKDDAWYLARHPLHLIGKAETFVGHDNAGVGPGLTFAESLVAADAKLAVGLIPCAVGGSRIQLWQKGAKLYDETVRRADLAMKNAAAVQPRLSGVLWLQGEANAKADDLPLHAQRLKEMIEAMRSDLRVQDLPFIACTIGEMGDESKLQAKQAMNRILLELPQRVPFTACVDARDLKTHIGDSVHFDTTAQEEIGRRFALKFVELKKQ